MRFRWLNDLDDERLEWFDQELHQGTLAELAQAAAGRGCTWVIPGERVTLLVVTAPTRNRATWLRALPYAVEDQLAEEVETLHFAVGPAQADGHIPVAILQTAYLETGLARCREAGVVVREVVPDFLLLPYESDTWSLLIEPTRVLVRQGLYRGFAAEASLANTLLRMTLHKPDKQNASDGSTTDPASESRAQQIHVYGDVSLGSSSLLTTLADHAAPHPMMKTAPQALLALAASTPQAPLNLLQGRFSQQAQWGKYLKPWRFAAGLVGLYLLCGLGAQVLEYRRLTQERAALQAEMEQIYRTAVPTATRIVNPRVQLEAHLRELKQNKGSQKAGFLELLYRSGPALIAFNDVTLRSLRYRNEQLEAELDSSNLEALDQLKNRLANQAGLLIDMRTVKQEDRIRSQLNVKPSS